MIDNPELVKWLLASGLKPTNDRRPPAPLLAATQMRRMESISLLLKHGADPYELSPDHISPVGVAIAFKSSSLLKLLDKDKKYSVELSKIEQELRSPKDTAFSGTWADLHEGFGSASLTLYSDGTGVFGSDVGGMPCVLRNDGKTTKLILLQGQLIEGTKLDERQEVDIKTAGDDLVLVILKDGFDGTVGGRRRLKCQGAGPVHPRAVPLAAQADNTKASLEAVLRVLVAVHDVLADYGHRWSQVLGPIEDTPRRPLGNEPVVVGHVLFLS